MMATRLLSTNADSASLADWVAWGQEVSNALAAFGWTKTSDTGQVNWGTIGAVPAQGLTTAYEVWTMPAAAGLTAIYLRINYSSNEIDFQLGRGTNGAGVLTGATAVRQCVFNPEAGVVRKIRTSGDVNRFQLGLFVDTANSGVAASIERSKNGSGADTDGFVSLFTSCVTACTSEGVYPSGSLLPVVQGQQCIVLPQGLSTMAFGGNLGISPLFPWEGKADNPLTGVWFGLVTDLTNDTQYTVSAYGSSRTVTSMFGNTNFSSLFRSAIRNSSPTLAAILLRYD